MPPSALKSGARWEIQERREYRCIVMVTRSTADNDSRLREREIGPFPSRPSSSVAPIERENEIAAFVVERSLCSLTANPAFSH